MIKLFCRCFALCFIISQAFAASQNASYHFIHVTELQKLLIEKKSVTVLDVRAPFAYRMEHISGALSVPLPSLQEKLRSDAFPKKALIVTYCGCPHHLAEMAADLFQKSGYRNVRVLDEGLPGWKEKGYPLEGLLANQPVSVFWVLGYVLGENHKPKNKVTVQILHPPTLQLEIGNTDQDGFFSIPLRFYGLHPGDELEAILGKNVIYFRVPEKTELWGIRIDDRNGRILLRPTVFQETFQEKKVHL